MNWSTDNIRKYVQSHELLTVAALAALVILSLWGVFEGPAYTFLKGVTERNFGFLALISEVKNITSGLGSVKIPFVSGYADQVGSSLNKAQSYLLLTSAISFVQVLFVSLSKTWVVKAFLVVLFVLTLIPKTRRHSTKLLVVVLALTPGLSVYTVAVREISKAASFDFGDAYLAKLKDEVSAIKAEHASLMQEHASQVTRSNNGDQSVVFLQRIKEDLSYDIKSTGDDIKGAYVHTRMLLSTAGHEMVSKVLGFCAMVVFCLLILPVGYALLVYVLFNSLFTRAEVNKRLREITMAIDKTSLKKTDVDEDIDEAMSKV